MTIEHEDSDDIEIRYKHLCVRRDELKSNHGIVTAHLEAHQQTLKKLMNECRDLGFDPDNLDEQIRRKKQVIELKLDTFEADVSAGEKVIRPMLDVIRRG